MFDPAPPNDEKLIHVPCPNCLHCNHVMQTFSEYEHEENDVSIYDLTWDELRELKINFPLLCVECNKMIDYAAKVTVAIIAYTEDETLNQKKH